MQEFIFKYVEEDDSYCALAYRGDEPMVVVPPMHWGRPVTMLYDDLFKGHDEICEVRLPDSLREIGGFVFDGCYSLKQLALPQGLQNMWQYAFVRSSIEEVVLPPSMCYVVPYTFKDCRQLRRVAGGKGLIKVWASAFDGCTALEELMLAPTTTVVGTLREGITVTSAQ